MNESIATTQGGGADLQVRHREALVSICIPTFNSADFIEETLRSVFAQTHRNIEIIITDDASEDETVKIVRELSELSPFPVTLECLSTNQGIEGNWNMALRLARGDYIKLLPADDSIVSECITLQLAQFSRYGSKIALTFGARDIVTRSGRHLMTARFYADEYIVNSNLVRRCIAAGTNVIGEPGAVLFPRKLAEKVGDFDGSRPYVIDLNYWLRLLEYGDAASSRSALSTFRIDQNLSVRIGWGRCTQYLSFISELASPWSVPAGVMLWGRIRTVINEFLRRAVHFVFRHIG